MRSWITAVALVAALAGQTRADKSSGGSSASQSDANTSPKTTERETAPRRKNASWREIFLGPFPSSRLFVMPTADVVGAFQLSLSGDASLLNETGVLSASSVVAIGFGDIAQLEYRNSTAISTLEDDPIQLPTLGVQLKAPFRRRKYIPALAVALRFGFPRTGSSADGTISHEERATDLYGVGSLRLWGPLHKVSLHGGVRVSSASIVSEAAAGAPAPATEKRTLYLPAGGWQWDVSPTASFAGELALVPLFDPGDATRPSKIGSGVFGRAGIRWRIIPSIVFDASVGYRIEVARLGGEMSSVANALVDWDIRLGGEILVPWGAVFCRGIGAFCE
jgi:hypothetical protein